MPQEGTLCIMLTGVMKMLSARLRHTGPGKAAVVLTCCRMSPSLVP